MPRAPPHTQRLRVVLLFIASCYAQRLPLRTGPLGPTGTCAVPLRTTNTPHPLRQPPTPPHPSPPSPAQSDAANGSGNGNGNGNGTEDGNGNGGAAEDATLAAFKRAAAELAARRKEEAMCVEDRIIKHLKKWMSDWEEDLERRPDEVKESGSGEAGWGWGAGCRTVLLWLVRRLRGVPAVSRGPIRTPTWGNILQEVTSAASCCCCCRHPGHVRLQTDSAQHGAPVRQVGGVEGGQNPTCVGVTTGGGRWKKAWRALYGRWEGMSYACTAREQGKAAGKRVSYDNMEPLYDRWAGRKGGLREDDDRLEVKMESPDGMQQQKVCEGGAESGRGATATWGQRGAVLDR